jgi:hypothetical protein
MATPGIVLYIKEDKIDISQYILKTDDHQVFSLVVVPALLDTTSNRRKIFELLNNGTITEFHYDKIIENLYSGEVKSTYMVEDPNIIEDNLDTGEMIDFTELTQEEIDNLPFTAEDTVMEAIRKVEAVGYYFVRVIKNNL